MLKKAIYGLIILAAGIGTLSCASRIHAEGSTGPFEYREIYLPEHGTEEYKALHLQNLDNEWGIWGHNIAQILPENVSQNIYSRRDGVVHKEQFCFSSNHLFEYISDFISSNYILQDSIRFAILPNDNAMVCLCEKCVAAGNTRTDASPAVMNMIKRLSDRFPQHIFFTSYYASTKSIPDERLPENAGVLISAIDFPLSVTETAKEYEFEKLLTDWSKRTDRIYVWDYVNDFDDYFTPYPVFGAMNRRLKMYRDHGVKGIFLNGSGQDYSTFSRLKTHVLKEMMEEPDVDWRTVLTSKAKELYPMTGGLIADFMMAQEDYVAQQGKELPLYDGISKALETYLPEDKFIEFHNSLGELKEKAGDEERAEMERMYNAMELTRLELMRKHGDISGYEPHLASLLKLRDNDDIRIYSETCWTLDSYERDFKRIASHAAESKGNKLKGVKLQALNALDPDYRDISVLTDGLLGMPSNYHNGILINSPEMKWSFAIPPVPGLKTIRIWLVTNPAYKVGLPKRINLLSGANVLGSVEPTLSGEKVGHTYVDFKVPSGVGTLTVTLARDYEVRSMALEEIEGF